MHTVPSHCMTKRTFLKTCLGGMVVVSSGLSGAETPEERLRAPSVPLITCDPYFSIWSNADRLTDAPTTHWTKRPNRLTSLVRIDGGVFRIMGDEPAEYAGLPQVQLAIYPTRTVYDLEGEGVHVTLTFMTAALPDDL